LKHEIDAAAEKALHGACGDADDGGDPGQNEAEQNRDAEAIEQARDDVAALIVGAEPVPFDRRATEMRFVGPELFLPPRPRIAPW